MARYRDKVSGLYFRADTAFANPEVYEFSETGGVKDAVRLPAYSML